MVVTFPHMGNIYIPLKAVFDDLHVKSVVPPFTSRHTLDIGTKIASDSVCLPLKINLGNYIESMEQGADTLILTGSCGPCRFGYYGVLEKEILEDNGYPVDMVILDPASGFNELYRRLERISGGNSLFHGLAVVKRALAICRAVDELEKLVFKARAAEGADKEADAVYSRFRQDVLKLNGSREILSYIESTAKTLAGIAAKGKKPAFKIGVIGEIYTIIEPYTNLNIEKKLGAMGVLADRSMTASSWICDKLFYRIRGKYADKDIYAAAKPYIDRCIGGHTQECIGHALRYARQGFDGAIQVLPFGCMPEIVSKTILPKVSADTKFPILTLVVDEMTGESGFATRLEAFLDMLRYRKKRGLS